MTKLDFLLPECKADFTIDKIKYHSISQWMAAMKAILFRDYQICNQIMITDCPYTCERLSKLVKGYNGNIWRVNIEHLYYRGTKAKLLQNTLNYLDFIMIKEHQLTSDILIRLKREFLM